MSRIAVGILSLCILYSSASVSHQQNANVQLDRGRSYLLAVTGKSGLFSFAAHQHAIVASRWTADANLAAADARQWTVEVSIPVAGLVIDSPEARRLARLDSGPSAKDVQSIQQRMLGPEVLDASRFPSIRFRSTSVVPQGDAWLLRGELTLHGQSHDVETVVRRAGDGAYDGSFAIRQTWFGMKPETVAGGSVKVKDEIEMRFHIVETK